MPAASVYLVDAAVYPYGPPVENGFDRPDPGLAESLVAKFDRMRISPFPLGRVCPRITFEKAFAAARL